ncbi:MAG: dephospho-CoA kinase [Elusimicrobia bacterium]|jgi:dephospho-CoA kinase|nr:dephospho-CoA kinase [Elusimicrobiota bacterium]MBK7207854.1 dephospho-CoA kinase [Elusimicrobiota bacterium]MBK7544616.1 dephospho-CoA kinase [Elusimicrobiota bacterium]MBK7574148.1 dephospho-CoA kinase [Elusimicrobiota bacterium]MBK7688911.1 dephospho-CoA kinase [Elusimicrobiota bacterium]
MPKVKAPLRSGPPVVVGLTGGLGAGKSTALDLLAARGAAVLSADAVVRTALERNPGVRRRVARLFGPAVLGPSGRPDRAQVAAVVFRDARARSALERILHPVVRRVFRKRRHAHRRGWLVFEVPLLFEAGFDRGVDKTLVVWAPARVVRERLARSRGWGAAEVRRRLSAQMPPAEKRRRADLVLVNDGTRAALRAAVNDLIAREMR